MVRSIEKKELGQAWLVLLKTILEHGERVGNEIIEVQNLVTSFSNISEQDEILSRFAIKNHIHEMRKVFFSTDPNIFGHNYKDSITGPLGKNDFSDVVELLQSDPFSKRALISLTGNKAGKVPCINAVHFLVRNNKLYTSYFARGQDVYNKFYADAVAISDMAGLVAGKLSIETALITGFMSSAHIYINDLEKISATVEDGIRLL